MGKGGATLAAADKAHFRRTLLRWYARNGRRFAWRETHDSYEILLAEVLLQRTQAPQVGANYGRVLAAFPTPEALGRAQLSQVREALKPFGLAKRAPTLWEMGSHLSDRFAGGVPLAVADLMSLPGVGRYIASATACFAGGVRTPVVDTNVIRIMSRYFGIESERRRPRDDPWLWRLAESLLPRQRFIDFNRALIDFAAIQCKARKPDCPSCPLLRRCLSAHCFIPDPDQ